MKAQFIPLLSLGFATCLISCNNELVDTQSIPTNDKQVVLNTSSKEELMNKFSKILSNVVSKDKNVRSFLKREALEQFNKNYDVLYQFVKDKDIDGETLRTKLIKASSEETISTIENAVPLLNIYLPDLSFIHISAENLDIEESELPVVVERNDSNAFYLKGKHVDTWRKVDIPDFHVLVVNENSRMKVSKPSTRAGESPLITFKSPVFDKKQEMKTRVLLSEDDMTYNDKLIQAYNYYNKSDGSKYQKAYQRDYIYYNMAPDDTIGYLNYATNEYLRTLKIDPSALYYMSDDVGTGNPLGSKIDPKIKSYWEKVYGRFYSEDELYQAFWDDGTYDIKFTIITGKSDKPIEFVVALQPKELWDFHINLQHRHGNIFRRHKNIYTLDPTRFRPKVIDMVKKGSPALGKWDLSKEGLERFIKIEEFDSGKEIETSIEQEFKFFKESLFKGDVRVKYFFGKENKNNVDGGVNYGNTGNDTEVIKKRVSVKYKEESDPLGTITVSYYDPIVNEIKSNGKIVPYVYSTGTVSFTLDVK